MLTVLFERLYKLDPKLNVFQALFDEENDEFNLTETLFIYFFFFITN